MKLRVRLFILVALVLVSLALALVGLFLLKMGHAGGAIPFLLGAFGLIASLYLIVVAGPIA